MIARAAAVLLAASALVACDPAAPGVASSAVPEAATTTGATTSTYTSREGHFTYRLPGAWSTAVRIVEEPGVSAAGTWPGVVHAVHFVYQPTGAMVRQQSVLSVLVYDEPTIAQGRSVAGVEAARSGGRVYMALIPSRNPYPAGANHERFAALSPTLDAVKGALAPQ